jgi:hypothetical protein
LLTLLITRSDHLHADRRLGQGADSGPFRRCDQGAFDITDSGHRD